MGEASENPTVASNASDDSTGREKFRELYSIAKEAAGREEARLSKLEEKAAKLTSALAFALALQGFSVSWMLANCVPIRTVFDLIVVTVFLATIALIVSCWTNIVGVLSTGLVAKYGVSDAMISMFQKDSLPTIYFSLTSLLRDAATANRDIGDKKATKLEKAQRRMSISMGLFTALVVALFVRAEVIYYAK